MLIREGNARNVTIDIRLAGVLAAVAGSINTAGFHAVGYYSANMTGNVSQLSDLLALGNLWQGLAYASIVGAFVFGAWSAAILIGRGRRRGVRAIYAYSILIEALVLIGLGLADLILPGLHRSVVLIYGLAFVMGLQNAAATRISHGRVRTTHVSGMATDIGIELANLIDGPDQDLQARAADKQKLRLHLMTIVAFIVGGAAGAWLYPAIGGGLLLCAAGVLLATALPEIGRARHLP